MNKPRVFVMTDISSLDAAHGEPDDTQSMVRLLLYANVLDLEGLAATWTPHGNAVHPEYIRALIGEYEKVRPNLLLHSPDYPTAAHLRALVCGGHLDHDRTGAGLDTNASEMLIRAADRPDPRPLWAIFWGGTRELAQALWKVRETRSAAELAAFVGKLRIYAIADQDATGPWLREQFPGLFYIFARHVFRGMYKDGDQTLVGSEWVEANIRQGHGALGAAYPNYQGGDPWSKVRGIKEGDTPSFLYLIPNGLSDTPQPTWGNWGGRFVGSGMRYTDAEDRLGAEAGPRVTVNRWRAAYQADFAARLDWCVKPFGEANHAPMAAIRGDWRRAVRPGERVTLDASDSSDPDGDALTFQWYYYAEPSNYTGALAIDGQGRAQASFVAPPVAAPVTLHIILTVTDRGEPPLSSYQRVVVKVQP